eukprot:TRINITY_DN5232_c0_g1_i9.p1 TRINITY_DN5232_c0_g1~~TRINITY_DN5232_c0_g1_i9.p1  ORF type:complete len:238 (-),score=17.22 TRINITY_DN5232_c0_g1_i9:447-1160(-)
MGLQFRDERSAKTSRGMLPLSLAQKILFFLVTVLLPYGQRRIEATAIENNWSAEQDSWRVKLHNVLKRYAHVYKVISAFQLVHFMLFGSKYRSIVELLIRARLVPARRHAARAGMPFDFLNQQLVFSGLTEFTRWLVPVLSQAQAGVISLGQSLLHQIQFSSSAAEKPEQDLDSSLNECSVCNASPSVMGFAGKCGHVGCYVCLKAALVDDPYAKCNRCGLALTALRRHEPWASLEE